MSSGSTSSPLRVLIVGAGSAGLLIAQNLQQVGISYTVFEQDASLEHRPRDWNFGIYWAQSRLNECLTDDLKSLLDTVETVPNYQASTETIMPIYNGLTGELLKSIPAPLSLRLRRKKWLMLISKDINIKVKWNKKLKEIETTENIVTITFEDGTQETGNLLIGAEGAHSPTRAYLLGSEEAALLMSPIVGNSTLTTLSKAAALTIQKIHPRNMIAFHPNGTFLWISIHDSTSDNPEEWTWMILQSWRSDEPVGLESVGKGSAVLEDMRERGEAFGSPFKEVFASIPNGTVVWHGRLTYWPTKPWDNHNGLVTLAGDSAHPMTFHRGQGLNNAITDAADLLQRLREMKAQTPKELAAAVKKYETELWPRGHEAVVSSLQNTNAIHDWNTMMNSPLMKSGLAKDSRGAEGKE
ncbi:hypothetical protein B7494_g3836 [Chlorociboria aeruginascens]|nr:hypothetical protein B7494_g3836 [Chlorociboria aeruginascens]